MDGVSVITSNPTVSVRVTSTANSFEALRRFNRAITVAEFKCKLELVVGIQASCMDLQLFSSTDAFLQKLDDSEALMGSYPVDDNCRIHVIDKSGSGSGGFEDLSAVEKFQLPDEVYDKRSESVRSFLKKNKAGRFNEEKAAQKEELQAQRDAEEKLLAEALAPGLRCEVQLMGQPIRRGTVMYVGNTEFKPGYWVGVKYDVPLGKHDGSVNGKQYFECQPKYGAFVKPQFVTVGDFTEEDFGLNDEM